MSDNTIIDKIADYYNFAVIHGSLTVENQKKRLQVLIYLHFLRQL